MSKALDETLDALMESKGDIIDKNATAKDREELITALREKLKADIIEEIRLEYKDEIVAQANDDIQKRVNEEKIEQLKSLMWNGFLVAFLVGLAINQITELITALKKLVPIDINIVTTIISIVLLGIVVSMYVYQFIKDAINTWNVIEKSNQKGEE